MKRFVLTRAEGEGCLLELNNRVGLTSISGEWVAVTFEVQEKIICEMTHTHIYTCLQTHSCQPTWIYTFAWNQQFKHIVITCWQKMRKKNYSYVNWVIFSAKITNRVRIDNTLTLFTVGIITGILLRGWCSVNCFQKLHSRNYNVALWERSCCVKVFLIYRHLKPGDFQSSFQ